MGGFTILKRITGRSLSSTDTHLEQDFDPLLATGIAAADESFYGIPLSSINISNAETESLIYLIVLLFVVLAKPAIRSKTMSIAFWTAALTAAYTIKEVTFYPFISAVILTRTSYPWLVVLPHCIVAAASYRKEKTSNAGNAGNQQLHYTCSFAMAFFCCGFGGSIVSDVLMGLPVTALGHSRIVPCWIVGWLLVWHSPRDIVFRLITSKSSVAFYFMNACEALDDVTTPMGRVSRSARELSNKGVAPVVAGILAGCGGAAIRYVERVALWGGGDAGAPLYNERALLQINEASVAARASRDAIEASAWKNFWYSFLWWYLSVYKCRSGDYDGSESFEMHHCREFDGSDWHRFVIVMAHVLWYFGCDLGLLKGHPLTFISRHLRNIGYALSSALQCGPQPPRKVFNGQGKGDKAD
mmetsp:Transcript_5736/g.12505  ORF Transcript_5736/g.12505 Transcript_5736/m.12505 type:complete len:414 (-) Transcript_5736:39-1280(-)